MLAVAGAALLAACSVTPAPAAHSATLSGSTTPARHVVAITVDGLNPRAITNLGPTRAAGLYRMMRYGASTLDARTAYEKTETMPNHTSVFTGRPVAGGTGHQVDFNTDDAHTYLEHVAGEYVPSMFDVVHDHHGSVYFWAGKDKFAFWNRSYDAAHGADDHVGIDDGTDKIDGFRVAEAAVSVDALVRRLHAAPAALSYLHIPLPDFAGHAHGFMSTRYHDAVAQSASLVNRVLNAVRGDSQLWGRTVVVLTADHGGGGGARGHADPTRLRNYRVPFMVWGAGVTPGQDLYALNPERHRPGTARPSYDGPQPVRNLDLASLVTTLLGLPAVPGGVLPGTTPLEVGCSGTCT